MTAKPYNDLLAVGGQRFVWGDGLPMSEGSECFSYLTDYLGSPIRLMSGEHQETLAYDEFGVPAVGPGMGARSFHNPFGFTGYQPDGISGLQYAQARYYAPTIGRFGAEDPIKAGKNWYTYCGNSPIAKYDPLGLEEANSNEELPLYNHVYMSHVKMIDYLLDLGFLIGSIGVTVTQTAQDQRLGFFHTFTDVGNDTNKMGVGINSWDWLTIQTGVESLGKNSGANCFVDLQLTPWIHAGVSVGLDGVSVNLGVDINETAFDFEIKVGLLTVGAVALTLLFPPAASLTVPVLAKAIA